MKITHISCGFMIGIFSVLLVWTTSRMARESAVVLTIFNLFFVVTTFALDGSLLIKLSLLLVGDATFLALNRALSYSLGSASNSGDSGALYAFLSSLFNLVWIVSFWSISLTILAKSKHSHVERGT